MRFARMPFLAALGIAGTFAFPAQGETLQSALASTYNENPTLNIQRAATRAIDESVPQAKVPFRPQIFASANAGVTRVVTNNGFGTTAQTIQPRSYSISIDQNLFRGFRTINSVKAAKANVLASREALRAVEQDVLLSAVTAYADVLLARETVGINKRNIAFLDEQVRSSQARLDVGEGTRTDLAQSQASLAQGQAELATVRANLDAAEATYTEIIQRKPTNLRTPKPPTNLNPTSLQQALSIAALEHPAIRTTQHLVDFAAFNVNVSEGDLLPTVTLNGSASRSFETGAPDTDSGSASATINLSVPIYQGGGVSSAIRQGKETLAQNRIEVDQARDQVRSAVVSAWTNLISTRATIRSSEEQVRASRIALEGVIEERNVGQRTQLSVLQTQSAELDAELLLVNSRRNFLVAAYGLLSAIGRLNATSLGLGVRVYDPKEHFQKTEDRWFGLRTPSKR